MSIEQDGGFVVEAFDAAPHPHAMAGVLFAEEFDLAGAALPPGPSAAAAPAIDESALYAARERGLAEGRAAALAELHAAAATAAQAAGDALSRALEGAEDAARAAAAAHGATLGTTMLRLLASAFPELCARHGATEAAAFAAAIVPMLTQETRVLIRANAHSVPVLAGMLAPHLADPGGRVQLIGTDALDPDDITIEWTDGAARRDMRGLRRTLNEALAPLGIVLDPPPPPTASPLPAAAPLKELAHAR